MTTTARCFAFLLLTSALQSKADSTIGFIEKFALAPDREKVLGELIPASEDYYFFHALHYQNTGQQEKLAGILQQWGTRFPNSDRRKIIENRSAILKYETDPKSTLEYLKRTLDLQFEDVQEVPDQKPDLPDTLDTPLISREAFTKEALENDKLSSLTENGLRTLIANKVSLSGEQRRELLEKITRPDVPGLVQLVVDDLKSKESSGFGEFQIHHALLPEQLDEVAKQVGKVKENLNYITTRMTKLAPDADKDLQFDLPERLGWLERLWTYAQTLPSAFNSLKAAILYQRLQYDRSQGIYDKARFTEYLKLPRATPWSNPDAVRSKASRELVDTNVSWNEHLSGFNPIGNDEPLVREFLLNILKDEPDANAWTGLLRETYVLPLFAEAKIVNGVGNPEQWASLLSAAQFQALKERVDVDFVPTNAPFLKPDDEVKIGVWIKNSSKVIIKTYEINTLNYYSARKQELNTDLTLDGLVANREETKEIAAPNPFRRQLQTFDFPDLKGKRGAWVIEFIGGGKSSRALIRKGNYRLLQQIGAGGDLVTVLDEANTVVKDATLWLEGRKFNANAETGKILVPFSGEPGPKQVVLANASGEFASLASLEHHKEVYTLDAQFHIEREQLLARKEATLAIRVALLCQEKQIPLELLTDPKLTLTVTTLDEISTTQEVALKDLSYNKDYTHVFTVPDRVDTVDIELTGEVEVISEGAKKENLSAYSSFSLNGIDRTEETNDTRLSRFGNDYVFELLGKNGEPVVDQQIQFRFKHRDFDDPIEVFLRTNDKGRTMLGALPEIESVQAEAPNERAGDWTLVSFAHTELSQLHAAAGETVSIPWTGRMEQVSLLEERGNFFRQVKEGIAVTPGFLVIQNLTPGDYSLVAYGEAPLEMTIRVTAGKAQQGWLFSPYRELQQNGPKPVQITAVETTADQITIKVANANQYTRVHVAATRFVPAENQAGPEGIFSSLGEFTRPEPAEVFPGKYPNLFTAQREIGDEYRYILERRYARRLPGNMLKRPELLLNPWEVRVADEQEAFEGAAGQAFGMTMGGRAKKAREMGDVVVDKNPPPPPEETGSSLDFLAETAPVLYNLIPDKDGVVKVARKDLKDRQHLQVYVEDPYSAAWQAMALPEVPTKFRDLRLEKNLDPAKPFVQSREVALLNTGNSLKIDDVLTSEFQSYDTLAGLYTLFAAINEDDKLGEFGWIVHWPELDEKEKLAKYSEFASHEVSFFLSRKDKPFFEKVILPYLKNKKDKTFMDHYLLGDDLNGYLKPWAYAQLNVVEKCLLAQRIAPDAPNTSRHIRELWELVPPNPERKDALFETALRGGALEEGEGKSDFAAMKEALVAQPAAPASPAPEMPAVFAQRADDQPKAANGAAKMKNGKDEAARMEEETMLAADATGVPMEADADGLDYFQAQKQRADARPFFRKLGPTKVWAENNYYKLPIIQQNGDLVKVNEFWRDYAAWDQKGPFLSANVAEATSNFTEMLLALAVLDLPFKSEKPKSSAEGKSFTLTASGPLLAYNKQITPATPAKEGETLLVSQNFFRNSERYREEGNEKFDRYVTGEFLTGVVYGANIVLTNPASSPQKVELLLQIPKGSMPVLGSKSTNSLRVRLEPYTTQTFNYYFYFPAPAKFPHYPVHVSKGKEIVAQAKPFEFNVVAKLSEVDRTSWDYVSQQGSVDEVFGFLEKNNLLRLNLERLAWRCRQTADFYRRLVAFMGSHHVYNGAIYRYSVFHNDAPSLSEWLKHNDAFLAKLGPWISTKLVTVDPIERRTFEHLEFAPLVNQRTQRFGPEYRIPNSAVLAEYQEFLRILSFKPALDAVDEMAVVYFLFLQDRAAEALDRMAAVVTENIATQLQLDYFRCYAAFYLGRPEEARKIATWHAEDSVVKWRDKFREVVTQLDEIDGLAAKRSTTGEQNRDTQQDQLASTEPSFEVKPLDHAISLTWNNLNEVVVNYYLLDPEFSFSANPFVAEDTGEFSIIKPNKSVLQKLPGGSNKLDIPVPDEFSRSDLLVEVRGGGMTRVQPFHANNLRVNFVESYGMVEVRQAASNKPLGAVYVKVYARLHDGKVRFYKDGYTDLRGKFDYATLNSSMHEPPRPLPESAGASGLDHPTLTPGELAEVEKLSVLVLSDTDGAEVRELTPPAE